MEIATEHESIARWLARPDAYVHRPERVEQIETHISHLFLAGSYVYKLKKPALGAELLRTDTIRRELFGTGSHASENDCGIYTLDARQRVYAELFRRGASLNSDRISVILDRTFSTLEMLNHAQRVACDPRSVFLAIECVCRPNVAHQRISRRLAEGRDASDARPEIYDLQRQRWKTWPANVPQSRIDTEQPLDNQVGQVIAALSPRTSV